MPDVPNVAYIRPEAEALRPLYKRIRACLRGKDGMVQMGEKVLPKPNATDTSPENNARYVSYTTRAVFYNVTARTLEAMVGEVFSNDPKIKVPDNMLPITKDANGNGVSLVQQAKKAVAYNLAYSRLGLFVDYPKLPEGQESFSMADLKQRNIRPTITLYSPFSIINWREATVGNQTRLTLVVLSEPYTFFDDGFEMKSSQQLKVLWLNEEGFYCVAVWRPESPEMVQDQDNILKGDKKLYESYQVFDGYGNPLTEIPFQFIGVSNNDSNPDNPALGDLVELNIAHYRNSADYEENCFNTGQCTPWVSGLTKEFVSEVWDGNTQLRLGSIGGVTVPEGGSFGIASAPSSTMPMEGMKHKEDLMVSLGARLVEDKSTKQTLGEAQMNRAKEASILTNAAANVRDAYNQCLKWCQAFSPSYAAGEIVFDFTGDFYLATLSTEERSQLMREWQMGAVTWEEYRSRLVRAGIAQEEDADKAWNQIKREEASGMITGADDGNI